VATLAAIFLSFASMSVALQSVPFGTAYAVWTGIGAAGGVLAGMVLFKEPMDIVRILCLLLIVTGIIGIKLATPDH
jgi:quaternary ammonium compound-resistance protein SugE